MALVSIALPLLWAAWKRSRRDVNGNCLKNSRLNFSADFSAGDWKVLVSDFFRTSCGGGFFV
jgi:hypothetical protein